MAKSKKGIGVFLISFMISFIILGCIFLLFFLYKQTVKTQQKIENIPFKSEYVPIIEENLNLLIIGCEKIELPPQMLLLLHYDAVEREFALCAIPPQTLSTVGVSVREDTLQGHYDYSGTQGLINAVKSVMLIDVDRYARLDRVGISNLIDFLGGVEFNVQDSAVFVSSDGVQEKISRGKQLLDGRKATAMLFLKDKDGKEDTQMQSAIMASLFEQRFTSAISDKWQNFVSAYFYNAQTNMNQYDFALRQRGIMQALETNSVQPKLLVLNGSYENENQRFIPYPQSITELADSLAIN